MVVLLKKVNIKHAWKVTVPFVVVLNLSFIAACLFYVNYLRNKDYLSIKLIFLTFTIQWLCIVSRKYLAN